MTKLLLANHSVKEEMAALVKEKLAYYRGTVHQEIEEDKVYREVEKLAIKNKSSEHTQNSIGILQLTRGLWDIEINLISCANQKQKS